MRFYCVRHGETEWNREGRFQGRTDIPLNSTGSRQADMVGKALASINIDKVWSSDLCRAGETAGRIAFHHGLGVLEASGITEISHGEWEGKTAVEIEDAWPGMLEEWHRTPQDITMPGGENLEMVRQRAVSSLSSIISGGGRNVVIVSHDALLKVLLCYWLDCPLSSFWRFQLGNCSITIVECTEAGVRIPLMGQMSHVGDAFTRVEQKGL